MVLVTKTKKITEENRTKWIFHKNYTMNFEHRTTIRRASIIKSLTIHDIHQDGKSI